MKQVLGGVKGLTAPEKARSDDPTVLRQRIKELEEENACLRKRSAKLEALADE